MGRRVPRRDRRRAVVCLSRRRQDGDGLIDDPAFAESLERGDYVAHRAAAHPDRLAVVSADGTRTFAELSARANSLSRALRSAGLVPGDRVAIMASNRVEYAEVLTACQQAGFNLTTINFHLKPAEAAYIVADSQAKAFVVDGTLGDTAEALGGQATSASVRVAIGAAVDGFDSYEALVESEPATRLDDPVLGGFMLYTSGTTGRPKGVFRPKPQPIAVAGLKLYGYDDRSVSLCTGPLYHAAPLNVTMWTPLAGGATCVLMQKWDAEETLRLIEAHRVTHTHMVATMFHRLLALPDEVRNRYDISSLRFILHGAAPCPVAVKQRLMDWVGPIVWEYYAATEGGGTLVDPSTWLERPGTVGQPMADQELFVGDESGSRLPIGEVGLVWIRAPEGNAFEYYGDHDKTSSAYIGDFFTLGDVGYFDADGFLYLTDRSANLIISGGVNIYPAEVDAVLLEHPAVGDVAVIGVPNEEWGEEVKAVVELRAGVVAGPDLEAELIGWCRERLAAFKCPRSVDFVSELPRQDNGKIYKRLLRENYRVG